MPSRADAIVVCSCGAKWGNAARAALHEDMEAVEKVLVFRTVPMMVRHWRLGHQMTAKGAWLPEIVEAARKMAETPAIEDET